MLDFFNDFLARSKGRVKDSSFIYIHDAVINNHFRVRDYVRASSMVVKSDHLIIKLLHNLGANVNNDPFLTIDNAIARLEGISNSFRLTSTSCYGEPQSGHFLDSGTELIMLTADDFDLRKPWQELEPIKFLYHTHTNVNYRIGAHKDSNALALITINLPMLAYQSQMWRISHANTEQTLYHYVVKYPILNSLKSYMDISMFNRHHYRVIGKPIPMDEKFGPIPIPDLTNQIDKSNMTIVNGLRGKRTTIGQALYTVPTLFRDSALDLVTQPDVGYCRQSDWFLLLHHLPYLRFGLEINSMSGASVDRRFMSSIQRDLQAFLNAKSLDKQPREIVDKILEEYIDPVNELLELLK